MSARDGVSGPPPSRVEGAGPEQEQRPLRIVGIGASAGGLKAISELLRALPADFKMAVVVVVHLDPKQPSNLAEILGAAGALPAHQAVDGVQLEPGHVYVLPPTSHLCVRAQHLYLLDRPVPRLPQRPVDLFLRTLAHEHKDQAIGVVLSGTGSDGTEGLQAVHLEGGITFAQDDSAEHGDMPRYAIATGCIDAVLPPAGIARELVRISESASPWLLPIMAADATQHDETEDALNGLVLKLSRATGIDFVNYKQTTVRRRIQRRILLLGLERVDEYVSYFDEHPDEAELLCQDLLIRVTRFFRDPEVFETLAAKVFPAIVEDRAPGDSIRIWMPGCATGEEVYSIAISLLEFLDRHSLDFPIKVFGTDVSEQAVAHARTGRYADPITADVSSGRLRRFFVREGEHHVVTKALRDLCVFARQDATRDPPFSNLDLISCRNLLIYLAPRLQKRVMPVFHYALREGGHLLLGTAESVGTTSDMFAAVDEPHSLYVRKSVPRRLPLDLGAHTPGSAAGIALPSIGPTVSCIDVQREADRVVLANYAPAGVLIDEALEVLQFRGDTGTFLTPAPGPPSHNVLQMAREGLLPDLREIIDEGKARGVSLRREGLRIKVGRRHIHASLELHPILVPGSEERCFVILFEEAPDPEATSSPPPSRRQEPRSGAATEQDPDRLEQLQRELDATRDFLRANIERLEASNEELRAANEEVLSSNEELQSTNEELQTAKEELQATNEELLTTNDELRHRNREVALLSDDLTNLLASVRIPMLTLGRDYAIRRFTPSAAKVFGLSASDMGTSVLDVTGALADVDLEALLAGVLDTLTVEKRDVQDEEGRWHSLSIRPYRTQDEKVDGAVITLTDIDQMKKLTETLERSRDFAESVVMSVRHPLLVVDADLSVKMSNRAFHDAFATTAKAIRNERLGEGATTRWVTQELRERLATVVEEGTGFSDLVVEGEVAPQRVRRLRVDARLVPAASGRERLLLVALEDVTDAERERVESGRVSQKLQEAQRLESLGVLAGGIAHDFNNILTSILGFAELIQEELPSDSPAQHDTENIVQSALRAAELCDEMLAYSGRGRFVVKPVDLSLLVEQSSALLVSMVSKGADLTYDLAAGLPCTEVDVAQIRQVLINLVVNASEALGEWGGTISVTTGLVTADLAYLKDACIGDVAAGEYVYLEVADDGDGMAAETQAHIFDPFFTTKFTGRGLGLASVLGIVRGHRGALMLSSTPGLGSTFRLLLPTTPQRAQSAPPPELRADATWRSNATVLVVDDEPSVRALLRASLTRLGIHVVEARTGGEAIELLRAGDERVHLMLLDLTMPGLSGLETLQEVRALTLDIPVFLMSGYSEEEALNSNPPVGLTGFLRKPFALRDLGARIRDALGQGSPEDAAGPPGA